MRELKPAFLAALRHYAEVRYNFEQPTYFVYTDPNPPHHQSKWSLEKTCELALKVIEEEPLYRLKFKTLVDGMHEVGAGRMYYHIMREEMPPKG